MSGETPGEREEQTLQRETLLQQAREKLAEPKEAAKSKKSEREAQTREIETRFRQSIEKLAEPKGAAKSKKSAVPPKSTRKFK